LKLRSAAGAIGGSGLVELWPVTLALLEVTLLFYTYIFRPPSENSKNHASRCPAYLCEGRRNLCGLEVTSHASQVAAALGVSFSTVWRRAEQKGIELTDGREAKGYKRLSSQQREKIMEIRRAKPAATQLEVAREAGVSRATVSGLRVATGAASRIRRWYSRCTGKGRSCGPDYGRSLQCLESEVEGAIELGLFGDRARQFRLHGGTLAAAETAAPQLGPQLLNVVVKRDHRALLVCVERRESGGHAGPGRVKDAGGAAQRGAGVPILPDVNDKPARNSALLAAGKLGAPRILEAARFGMA
jgi:hypothetical protein